MRIDDWHTEAGTSPSEQLYNRPQYMQIRETLAGRIANGEFASGQKLPSERELCKTYLASRTTVRQALLYLEGEGLISRRDRSGWYVSPPRIQYDPSNHVNFARIVEMHGRHPSWELLELATIEADDRLAGYFDSAERREIIRISSVSSIDGRRTAAHEYFLCADRFPGFAKISYDRPLTDILRDHYGITTKQKRILIRPTRLNIMQARALGVTIGAPGVFICRTKVDSSGRVVEVDHEFWRHDAIEFVIEQV